MARTVFKIPKAGVQSSTDAPKARPKKRVAAYARVSTLLEEQASSYQTQVNFYNEYINSREDWEMVKVYADEGISATNTKRREGQTQVNFYNEYINSREDWEMVKVYADEGISATNTKRREGFKEMVHDALNGKIDLIITKSISREDWEMVKVYADEGISATNTKRREGFKEMVHDALNGKIDLIITKSISRFARNTVDSLQTIRQLKEKGVEVYFEKENIWTLDSKGEVLLTIMSSLAQEESRSISENVKWGARKRFAEGKASVAYSRFLGYDKDFKTSLAQEESRSISENVKWGARKRFAEGKASVAYSRFLGYDKDFKINEEEAATVRKIFGWFLQGHSYIGISRMLNDGNYPTASGKGKWNDSTVKRILTNEKYNNSLR